MSFLKHYNIVILEQTFKALDFRICPRDAGGKNGPTVPSDNLHPTVWRPWAIDIVRIYAFVRNILLRVYVCPLRQYLLTHTEETLVCAIAANNYQLDRLRHLHHLREMVATSAYSSARGMQGHQRASCASEVCMADPCPPALLLQAARLAGNQLPA